jgi:TPR repeat protein
MRIMSGPLARRAPRPNCVRSVPQHYAQSTNWYRKAADEGDARGQYDLGNAYRRGEGVPRDYAQAANSYRKAAKQGFAEAQVELGAMYLLGDGVPKDYAVAANWFRKAAEQGMPAGRKIWP